MPADYDQVLRDLDEQVAALEAELNTLKAGRPTIVMLRNKYTPTIPKMPWPSEVYAALGPTDAIPVVLKGQPFPMTTAQIAAKLQAGGIKSNAQNFVASVSATLSQLREKGIVRKVGDAWTLASQTFADFAATQSADDDDDDTVDSAGEGANVDLTDF